MNYNALTFYLGCISAFVIIIQLYLVYKTYKADHERRMKQATIESGSQIGELAQLYSKKIYEKFGNRVINVADLDDDSYKYIRKFLSHVEILSVGVNTGVYDLNIVNRMFGTYLLAMKKRIEPYMAEYLKNKQSKTVFSEYLYLCDKIKELREKKQGVCP